MERRDLLKDQIEQLGRVLGKILAHFIGLKSKGQTEEGIEVTSEQLRREVDIDIEKMLLFNNEELRDYIEKRKLAAWHLEILSEYVVETAENKLDGANIGAKRRLEVAMELLDIADEVSNSASLDRTTNKRKIENLLQQAM